MKRCFPDEYMDDYEKFNETSLPEKEDFYSCLNMEDITDSDYMHAKRFCKDFEIKNLREYHDLYLRYLEICVLKYINLISIVFLLHQD